MVAMDLSFENHGITITYSLVAAIIVAKCFHNDGEALSAASLPAQKILSNCLH